MYRLTQRVLLLLLVLSLLPACALHRDAGRSEVGECPVQVNDYVDGHGRTGIQGKVFIKGSDEPLTAAFVNIYSDTISNLLGPSRFISQPTDAEGYYSLDLSPGTYYVVARKRMSGQSTGPLSPGDFYSEHQRIVTTVVEGKISRVDLEVVPMKAPMFFKKEVVARETDTGIRGILLDRPGNPVAGGFAMAYSDQDLKRLPDYGSTLSDAEGRFTIYLPSGGTYYLAARIHAWDMPRTGEPYGILGGQTPTPVVVEKGQFVEGLIIEMAPFAGEYKPGKSRRPY
ncbi:hypothetical protein DSOUD_3392 [Desulfuromonas soudanensis]|uniref:Carboxypeptidase regulatory-like domain-containing protein n=1 Tax=Desulfuromonas soudanensis TaxID=1603606 RepID=A0A0M5ILQ5_9BACT|nr:hypothetical protein [Desulfuromonas soudanensis]ALC18111.1 hypothetical protein DSOUD_3392 [Desulfuromonas soudanensis]